MKARALCVIVLLFVSVTAAAGDTSRRDGNDWMTWNEPTKAIYLSGIFDGVPLGNNLTFWGNLDAKGSNTSSTWTVVVDPYRKMISKYFSHVNGSQISGGLDDFYKDYRNRSIEVKDAIWIVVNEIACTSKVDIEKLIENFRRNASCDNAPC